MNIEKVNYSSMNWGDKALHIAQEALQKIVGLIKSVVKFIFCIKTEKVIPKLKPDAVAILPPKNEIPSPSSPLNDAKEHPVEQVEKEKGLPDPVVVSVWPPSKLFSSSLAASILTSGEFEKDPSDKAIHSQVHPFYVGDMQGNVLMRQGAKKHTALDPHAISPKSLKQVKEANLRNFLILQIKRYSHATHLTGHVEMPDKTKIDLEGFDDAFTGPMLASSYDSFASQHRDKKIREDRGFLVKAFNEMIASDSISPEGIQKKLQAIQSPNFEGPIVIGSGYDWHFVGVIFYRNLMFVVDPNSSIKVYTYEKDQITIPWLTDLCKRHEHGPLYNQFDSFQMVFDQVIKKQKHGHCTFTGAKRLFMALKAIQELMSISPDEFTDENQRQILRKAFDDAIPAYKEWTVYDRRLAINDLVNSAKKIMAKKKASPLDMQVALLYYSVLSHEINSKKVSNHLQKKIAKVTKNLTLTIQFYQTLTKRLQNSITGDNND